MEEIALSNQLEEGIEEGEFDSTYRWQAEVKKIEVLLFSKETDYRPPVDLFQVQVRIIWKSGNKERMTRIETFKAVKPETNETKTL